MGIASRIIFRDFLTTLNEDETKEKCLEYWPSRPAWTSFMLGDSASRKEGKYGIWGKLGKGYGLKVQAEWMRIDQIWFDEVSIKSSDEKDGWVTEVAIEHENDENRLERTVWKLSEFVADLKVIINYPTENNKIPEFIDIIRDVIIYRSVIPQDRYLVIFGARVEDEIRWAGYEFNSKGHYYKLNHPLKT